MEKYEPRELFTQSLKNDVKNNFIISDALIEFSILLGTNLPVLKAIYCAFRNQKKNYIYKPMIGKETSVSFDYDNGLITITRNKDVTLSIPQFIQLLGKIDMFFSPILPIGSTIELDESMLPNEVAQELLQSGSKVTLTARKINLADEFNQYIVDYLGYLWPLGELPGTEPIFISNMMIKRVVQEGYRDEEEEEFSLEILRKGQIKEQFISTAFMSKDETKNFFDTFKQTK